MNSDTSPVSAAARRLLAMRIPDTIHAAFVAEYGVDLRPDSTYEDLVIARLRQLARVDLEAAALLSRYNIGVLEEEPTERGDCCDCL